MVGLRGFEPPTLCTPCKCASQTALQPEKGVEILGVFRVGVKQIFSGCVSKKKRSREIHGNAFLRESREDA